MLISRLDTNRNNGTDNSEDVSIEYQTASELIDLMAMDGYLNRHDGNCLTAEKLMLIYQNIDVETQMTSDLKTIISKPNQHVEAVVYRDESESDSDISDICSDIDARDVVMINNETLDILTNVPSLDNRLCYRSHNFDVLASEYDKYFLFKDPYIKEQLNSLKFMSSSSKFDTHGLPASLLDNICFKKFEYNYNIYMENVIRYVKQAIEQLKRISNGDYLTDKTKRKWKQVKQHNSFITDNKSKVLSISRKEPLQKKHMIHENIWDDIELSILDVASSSLPKILAKKIIIEVPKLISGSFELFSRCCPDNFIINYKDKEIARVKKTPSKNSVDVLLQLDRFNEENLKPFVNFSKSIKESKIDCLFNNTLLNSTKTKIIEIAEEMDHNFGNECDIFSIYPKYCDTEKTNLCILDANDRNESDRVWIKSLAKIKNERQLNIKNGMLSNSSFVLEPYTDVDNDFDFSRTIQMMNKQISLPEENEEEESFISKKRSLTKVRVKSPYENKSFVVEDKKRRKLLEIRQKREKKKLALAENCKISKPKNTRSAILAQPSSSVTKLSITNKSFYNSIYGKKNMNLDKVKAKVNNIEVTLETEKDDCKSEENILDINCSNDKYLNRNYFLDNAETEIMRVQMEKKYDDFKISASTSAVSNEFETNLNIFSRVLGAQKSDFVQEESLPRDNQDRRCQFHNQNNNPDNTPKQILIKISENDKNVGPTVECRKSIDKLYDLMNTIKHIENVKCFKSKSLLQQTENEFEDNTSLTAKISDSETSTKHHLTSSNPSSFSMGAESKQNISNKKMHLKSVVPKVIISAKTKLDIDCKRKDKKKSPSITTVSDNPLKAISQLLHDIDNVQKTRLRAHANKVKSPNKEIINDVKVYTKRSISSHHQTKQNENGFPKLPKHSPRDKLNTQIPLKLNSKENKHVPRNIDDLINEAKEAKGEAVKGPKTNNRLHTLSQPKKQFINSQNADNFKRRKNFMFEKSQNLLASSRATHTEKNIATAVTRGRPPITAGSMKSPQLVVSHERNARVKRSVNSSPEERQQWNNNLQNRIFNSSQSANDRHQLSKKKHLDDELNTKNTKRVSFVRQQQKCILEEVPKSRAPLSPEDLDFYPVTSSQVGEKSTVLGSKLHDIVTAAVQNNTLVSCTEQIKDFKVAHDQTGFSEGIKDINTSTLAEEKVNEKKTSNLAANNQQKIKPPYRVRSQIFIKSMQDIIHAKHSTGSFHNKKYTVLKSTKSNENLCHFSSGDIGTQLEFKKSFTTKCSNNINSISILSQPNWPVEKSFPNVTTVAYAFTRNSLFPRKIKHESNSVVNIFKTNDLDRHIYHINYAKSYEDIVSTTQQLLDIPAQTNIKDIMNKNDKINIINKDINNSRSNTNHSKVACTFQNNYNCNRSKLISSIPTKTSVSSLDILVGVLNEIQKISTCHSRITRQVVDEKCENLCNRSSSFLAINNLELNMSQKNIPLACINDVQKSSCSPSIYSFNFYNDVEIQTSFNKIDQMIQIESLLSVRSQRQRETVVKQQDVADSDFLKIKATELTEENISNVTDSLQSLVENSTMRLSTSTKNYEKIKNFDMTNDSHFLFRKAFRETDEFSNQIIFERNEKCLIKNFNFQLAPSFKSNMNKICFIKDPRIKIKRDILVTLYSVLVFTVFAALSLPNICYIN